MEAILRKEIIINKTLCRVLGVLTFVLLTTLGAFVRIPLPFTPVPLTLQTFFVLLCGALLTGHLGTFAQSSYIFLGILGLPLFAGAGSGLSYLAGPTGGYIFGFILANLFIERFKKTGRNAFITVFIAFFIADLIILSMGTLWLRLIFGFQPIKLLLIGFLPFLPGDLLKVSFATFVYLKLKPRLEQVLG